MSNINKFFYLLKWGLLIYVMYGVMKVNLDRPFWLDEVYSVITSSFSTPIELIKNYFLGLDQNPPLYFIVLNLLLKIFGENVIAMKMMSFIFVMIGFYFLLKIEYLKNGDKHLLTALFFFVAIHIFLFIKRSKALFASILFSVYRDVYIFKARVKFNKGAKNSGDKHAAFICSLLFNILRRNSYRNRFIFIVKR